MMQTGNTVTPWYKQFWPWVLIGLPTSVGYGIAEKGNTALRSMLCSCSPGLVVVNIDNGVGAALSALAAAKIKTSGLFQNIQPDE